MTTMASRGIATVTSLRLCSRAPVTTIWDCRDTGSSVRKRRTESANVCSRSRPPLPLVADAALRAATHAHAQRNTARDGLVVDPRVERHARRRAGQHEARPERDRQPVDAAAGGLAVPARLEGDRPVGVGVAYLTLRQRAVGEPGDAISERVGRGWRARERCTGRPVTRACGVDVR